MLTLGLSSASAPMCWNDDRRVFYLENIHLRRRRLLRLHSHWIDQGRRNEDRRRQRFGHRRGRFCCGAGAVPSGGDDGSTGTASGSAGCASGSTGTMRAPISGRLAGGIPPNTTAPSEGCVCRDGDGASGRNASPCCLRGRSDNSPYRNLVRSAPSSWLARWRPNRLQERLPAGPEAAPAPASDTIRWDEFRLHRSQAFKRRSLQRSGAVSESRRGVVTAIKPSRSMRAQSEI